jgi:phospholipase C
MMSQIICKFKQVYLQVLMILRSLPDTPTPPAPATAQAPVQAAGARPARALPYALNAHASVERPGQLRLQLHNQGHSATVVQVYDRLRLTELPRRYTVGPGQTLSETWATQADGLHDLWLLGPNGWHRQFRGRARVDEPTAKLLPRADSSALSLSLHNPSAQAITWRLQAAAYQANTPRSIELAASERLRIELPLDPQHHWYDWVLTRADAPTDASVCLKRWAGHVETGHPSLSDPAMHGEALLRAWDGDWPPARPAARLASA